MDSYATGTANDPEEEEVEENAEGNRKQPVLNPIRGSHIWEKESAARSRSERARNLPGYAMRLANEQKDDEEE